MVRTLGSAPHPTATHKKDLSLQRRQLLELLQQVNFGGIEDLVISGGEPALDPLPRIIHEIKFGGENGARPELVKSDFLLKSQVVELFAYLDELQDGVIQVLEIKHGLPFRVTAIRSVA